MFLATTALEAFWDRGGPVMYLGAWCLPWDRRGDSIRPGDIILPSAWDDRTRYYEAARYADRCSERLLARLSAYLDDTHGERHGLPYWRVILGPWVMYYVHAAYDRWVHLEAAFAREPRMNTIVLDTSSYLTPRTVTQMQDWLVDDAYNLQFFSQLLEGMGLRFPARRFDTRVRGAHQARVVLPRRRWGWRRVMYAAERALAIRLKGRVGFSGMPFSLIDRWRVVAATRGSLFPVPPMDPAPFAGTAAVFDRRRCAVASLDADSPFERAIVNALPVNLPTLYLEGHPVARAAAQEALRRLPIDALISETDWYRNEPLKYLAGEARSRGAKLVAVQHGGAYGMYRVWCGELHEKRMADRFLVWGWADECPLRNWPSVILSRIAGTNVAPARRRSIGMLFVGSTQRRYLHQFTSQPAGTQLEDYFEWQARFLDALPLPLQRTVLVRPHELDYGQHVWPRLSSRFRDVRRDRRRSLTDAMKHGRLIVIDHCGTAMLEAFVADVPTVLFWNPARWELRPSAQPLFDDLRRVGVLHDGPEGAAHHVQLVYGDASAWWRTAEIQSVRRRFVERFAFHRRGGVVAWAEGLADEVTRA